jgi:iron complex outermembrane receptor protein
MDFSSRKNADEGRISGVELSVYQPFRFLPRPFDGFGIEANYTRISSSVKIPTRPGEDLPFFRQPDDIVNATLFYEKARFSGRVAYSYASEQLLSVGGNVLADTLITARGQYDALFSYRISDNYRITASVRNVTREPEERSRA